MLTVPPSPQHPGDAEWSSQLVARLQAARLEPDLAAELSTRCTTLTGLALIAPATAIDHAHMLWFGCSRGQALIAQALAWNHATIGNNRKAKPTDTARGSLWRYVMAYSGWEQIAKALCWRGPADDKLHPDRLSALSQGLSSPPSPWSSQRGCPAGFRSRLTGEAEKEASLLRLLAIQRNLVAHGALSPTRARTWKLVPAYESGVGLIAQLSRRAWGILA